MEDRLMPFWIACLGLFFISIGAIAHGTHATFVSPDKGVTLIDQMFVHIKREAHPFPYVHITVREVSSEEEVWAGLVPISDTGYLQAIDIKGWNAGTYTIQAQFLGDIVEQRQQRTVTVGKP